MSKLGTNKKPAVIRVQTQQRAQEILSIANERGWKIIVGVEPDKREDISDFERLLHPPKSQFITKKIEKPKHSKNAPCPCGSGIKYKKCCMGKDIAPSES